MAGGKLGLVRQYERTHSLEFSNLKQPIRSITFYIEELEGSQLRVETSGRMRTQSPWEDLAEHFFAGIHSKNTSRNVHGGDCITRSCPIGGSLRIRYTLVSGKTFQDYRIGSAWLEAVYCI
jgi:hypothetical protein